MAVYYWSFSDAHVLTSDHSHTLRKPPQGQFEIITIVSGVLQSVQAIWSSALSVVSSAVPDVPQLPGSEDPQASVLTEVTAHIQPNNAGAPSAMSERGCFGITSWLFSVQATSCESSAASMHTYMRSMAGRSRIASIQILLNTCMIYDMRDQRDLHAGLYTQFEFHTKRGSTAVSNFVSKPSGDHMHL